MNICRFAIQLTVHSLLSLQFSAFLQSLRRESADPVERTGAVRRDVGHGDDNIHYDHLPAMARIGVGHCGGIVNIHFDLFAAAHAEGRGAGVRVMRRINQRDCKRSSSKLKF